MGIMLEYINRRLSGPDLESELKRLIAKYNDIRSTYLLVYAAAIGKALPPFVLPEVALEQRDLYVIHDLLANMRGANRLDFYLETPGGSGETAEEIVRFLHDNFGHVSFVISGEAKSAGTILALSGNEILMTETGSLGPIDAQVRIGRSVVSAYDYMEWVNQRRKQAEEEGRLNPFDAVMVAQISPGELESVSHAMAFAQERVREWLAQYKFREWQVTETRRLPVTDEKRQEQANEIAVALTDRSKWRLHGRSIKIEDLENIGLRITKIDDDRHLADVVYRIQAVCRLVFESTTAFKIFATMDEKIFRHVTPAGGPPRIPQGEIPAVVELQSRCPRCGAVHKLYAKIQDDPRIDDDFRKKGVAPFPKNAKITCQCGYEIDVSGAKTQIELQTGRRILTE